MTERFSFPHSKCKARVRSKILGSVPVNHCFYRTGCKTVPVEDRNEKKCASSVWDVWKYPFPIYLKVIAYIDVGYAPCW